MELPEGWKELSAVRRGEIYAVDGTAYFSRPGPQLIDGLEILAAIVGGHGLDDLPPGCVGKL
jgi:iron complex transport system substrate-binding protein